MRVLLAEHQKHARRLLGHLLSLHAVELTEVEDTESCLAAAGERPQLALVDWRLPPDADGRACSELRRMYATGELFLVAIVAANAEDMQAAARAAGADDVLKLPAALDTVRHRLDEFLSAAASPAVEVTATAATEESGPTAALDFIDGPAFALDQFGVLQFVNHDFVTLSGLPADALQGLPGAVLGLTLTAVNTGSASLLRPDGSVVDVLLRKIPIAINGPEVAVFSCDPGTSGLSVDDPPATSAQPPARDLYLMFERGGAVRTVSEALATKLGYGSAELSGVDIRTLLHPEDIPKLRDTLPRRGQATAGALLRLRSHTGQWMTLRFTGRSAAGHGGAAGFVLVGHSPTEQQAAIPAPPDWSELDDRMAALPGRQRFVEELAGVLADPALMNETHGVLVVGIDEASASRVMQVDRGADQLLAAVAERLRGHVRSDDLVGQTAAGELAILARNVRDEPGARKIAERTLHDFRSRPLALAEVEITLAPSIGIALGTSGASDAEVLLTQAAEALTHARSVPGSVEVFRERSARRASGQLGLESELQRAIARDELRVFYQPEVDLRDGSMLGVEALVRWQHPQQGLLLPGDFLSHAEATGDIRAIGSWVLDRATHDVAEWQQQFALDERFTVGVNFSADQLRQVDVVDQVARALRRSGLPPRSLRLEIAEALLVGQDAELLLTLDHLNELGLQLVVDDFEADYSALGYLRWLPATTLKVERGFANGGRSATGRLSIMHSAASIARSVGMELVVKGIESRAELDRVIELEIPRGQGFYFSRAVSRDTLGFLLAAGPHPFGALLQPPARE